MSTTTTKRFAGIVAGFGLVLTAILALPTGAANASESPSCYGAGCEGIDPATTNCTDDAVTLLSRRADVGTRDWGVLELRYSPSCHSNWARFTPWGGLRGWAGNLAGKGELNATPYIWRDGVADSLRGQGGHSSGPGLTITNWTSMITADGKTCSSAEVYEDNFSKYGGGGRDVIGTYNAPCIS
jgi:hypothetical protein